MRDECATVRKTLAGPHIRARDFIEVFPLPAQHLFVILQEYGQLPGYDTEAAEAPAGAFEGSAGPQSGLTSERRTGGHGCEPEGPSDDDDGDAG
jgi:hypothetical protein